MPPLPYHFSRHDLANVSDVLLTWITPISTALCNCAYNHAWCKIYLLVQVQIIICMKTRDILRFNREKNLLWEITMQSIDYFCLWVIMFSITQLWWANISQYLWRSTYCTPYPKLAYFVLCLKIINTILKNNICISQ